MSARTGLVERVAALVGGDVLTISDAADGWPALGEIVVDGVPEPVALFVSRVGRSHRQRDDVERRFQNPAGDNPIVLPTDRRSLLIGLWDADDLIELDRSLLVSADPSRRAGRTTRFSVFASMEGLRTALATGWDERENSQRETIRCFVPPLLPVSVLSDRDGVAPEVFTLQAAIESSGLLETPEPSTSPAAERTRRVGSVLVRDARFARRVVGAYDRKCAMCGIGLGLVQGAHIYPASAPGSPDEPWNGFALCANHHLAFDRHLVAIRPATREIVFHPAVQDLVAVDPAVERLVRGTFGQLVEPADPSHRLRAEMVERRYEHFEGRYDWLPDA